MAEFSWAYIDSAAIVSASGPTGSIQYRVADSGGNTAVSGTQNFVFHTASSLLAITGSVEISGTLTANQYNINVIDKTVTNLSASGDTIFGDTADDTHQFTGSVYVNGPLSASTTISASAFYGDGSTLDNISTTSMSGAMGQFNTTSGLLITSGNVYLGDGAADVVTVASQLTASQGALLATSTIINATHVSSSLNISGSSFYGDGTNLAGVVKSAAGSNNQIQFNNSGQFGASPRATIDAGGSSAALIVTGSVTITGSADNTETIIDGTHVSSSLNISGSSFYGDGTNLAGVVKSAAGSNNQIQFNNSGQFGASPRATIVAGASSTAVIVTGSVTVTGSASNTTTTIDGTHVSSSLNISGSSFYGDGTNLTGVVKGAAGSSGQIQFNNAGALGAAASFAVAVHPSGLADMAVTGSTTTVGSVQTFSGSTQVFGIDSTAITGLGAVRGRMVQHIRTGFDLDDATNAKNGRYVSIGGNAVAVSATPSQVNCMITPFSGRLISIMYHMPSPASKQDPSKGQPQWQLRVGDVNELKGQTFANAFTTTGQITASSWPGNSIVGGVDVQTKVGSLHGNNITGSFSFGTGSVVALFFKSGDTGLSANNFPGAASFTTVWEFDQLDPYITGSGN